ncbi:hypothetical protein SAMN05421805_101282 [Saccharopolyspora antimicrobica]|uniref:Uncharacterized protein n=1 Tax=Saccharopolyspora antimicrobica TaxID=455193 RepID=A0A1I4QVM1_9PSEU|nr:hypothetical protein [Saccharopolyspora antimicrobica]SFM44122.1 hypothetical protein SAMN05421805_101282 [Saccharopolyspora antimicrobica]
MLAVGCDRWISTAAGPVRADVLAAELPRHAWQRLSAGPSAKDERVWEPGPAVAGGIAPPDPEFGQAL